MSRYIDADALLLKIDLHGTNKFGMLDEDIREFIRSIPTADVTEVLRCKDCKYCGEYSSGNLYCRNMFGLSIQKQDDFCSFGERNDENEQAHGC